MARTEALEEAAFRAAGDVAPDSAPWTSCHLTFEKPALFAASDELWVHLDVLAPGRQLSITRTLPAASAAGRKPTEEFVRQTFLGARRALGVPRVFCEAEDASLCASLAA